MRDQVIKAVCVTIECAEGGCIDTDATTPATIAKYVRTRDLSLLKFRPGKDKVVFHVDEIPRDLWPWVQAGGDDEEKAERAFRAAVIRVENALQVDGVRVTDWKPTSNGQRRAMAEEDAAAFSPAERLEIGGVAFTHAFLPKRIGDCFRLHALSAAVWGQLISLRADASPTDAQETSSETPSPKSDSSPSKDETDSGSEMAAGSSA